MTDDQADAVLERMCGSKVRYSARVAREVVDSRRRTTKQAWHTYRCLACRAWHLSTHQPSMATIQSIADAIRHRAGNDPSEHRKAS